MVPVAAARICSIDGAVFFRLTTGDCFHSHDGGHIDGCNNCHSHRDGFVNDPDLGLGNSGGRCFDVRDEAEVTVKGGKKRLLMVER
jgi:hypothetical protein